MSGCCQNGTCSKCQELIKILTGSKSDLSCGDCLRFEIYDYRNTNKGYCRKPNGRLKLNEFGKFRVFGANSSACGDYKPLNFD